MAAIIELKNVSFSAQNDLIVDDVSCRFEEGKTTAIVGPSGSGKSTVLKLSAGILVPSTGEVCFMGKDIFNMTRQENLDFRRQASMVFQDSALWANQSLLQSLELPLRIHFPAMSEKERKARIDEVLKEVGYKKSLSIRPSQLSMGEQKLIAFARALMCSPGLLFLDEWIESLDESAGRRLTQLVHKHKQEQKTAIFVSHDFDLIRSLADYIIMIVKGKVYVSLSRKQMDEDEELIKMVERGIAS
jgi:ABC-type transporter Mla maintaining outer membrane lipid asymmetry ATPase subunit MlaF